MSRCYADCPECAGRETADLAELERLLPGQGARLATFGMALVLDADTHAADDETRRLARGATADLMAEREFRQRDIKRIGILTPEGQAERAMLAWDHECRIGVIEHELERRRLLGPVLLAPRQWDGEYSQRLKAMIVLPEFIGRTVDLKPHGAIFFGCCPFHTEKTGSLAVWRDHYKCFGCGVRGDIYEFLMQTHGYGFVDAVRELGAWLHEPMPTPKPMTTGNTLPRQAVHA